MRRYETTDDLPRGLSLDNISTLVGVKELLDLKHSATVDYYSGPDKANSYILVLTNRYRKHMLTKIAHE